MAKLNNLPKHHGAGPNAAASVASALGRPWPACGVLILVSKLVRSRVNIQV